MKTYEFLSSLGMVSFGNFVLLNPKYLNYEKYNSLQNGHRV